MSANDNTNIVVLPVVTRLDIPAGRVLDSALKAGLETAVVIGYDADGEFWFGSNKADGGNVLWLLEKAKLKLFQAAGVVPSGE